MATKLEEQLIKTAEKLKELRQAPMKKTKLPKQ